MQKTRLDLDSPHYSFAWHPRHVEQQQGSPLWLPGQEPACFLVHFSRLTYEGEEKSWVWIFSELREPLRLRSLPDILTRDPNLDPIRAALPPQSNIVVQVDPKWLTQVGEGELEEIWIGFDHRRYYQDRNLRSSARVILPYAEFCARCR